MTVKPLQQMDEKPAPPAYRDVDGLLEKAQRLALACTGCGLCAKDCGFLQQYGTPGEIAQRLCNGKEAARLAYECSMCGLCNVVCPVDLNPRTFFADMRRQAVDYGTANLRPYRRLLAYEAKGASPRYSFYHLPENCRSVLFPGCTLPGTRPEATQWLIDTMRGREPSLGVVLDCCHKPSEDLGRMEHFQAMFDPLKDLMLANGVERVLVACPNCHATFAKYAPELEITTVYEELTAGGIHNSPAAFWVAAVHDPCAIRGNTGAHSAVRDLIGMLGGGIQETKHSGEKTICCGEGGAVGFVNPGLAKGWTGMRAREANGNRVVTYCAGCAGMLTRQMDAVHILDLLVSPSAPEDHRPKVSGWPWTYFNRLRLKKDLARRAVGGLISQRK